MIVTDYNPVHTNSSTHNNKPGWYSQYCSSRPKQPHHNVTRWNDSARARNGNSTYFYLKILLFYFLFVVYFQIQAAQGEGTPVHTIQTIAEGGAQGEVVDLNSVAEATLNSEGQIILTAEDGHGKIAASFA